MIWYWTGNFIILSVIAYQCYKRLNYPFTKPFFFPALILKLLAGIGVGLLYIHYYHNGDTIRFQMLSNKLSGLADGNLKEYLLFVFHGGIHHPFSSVLGLNEEPRTLFFIKFLSLLNLITGGNYWLNALYLSFFSFIGAWLIIYSLSSIRQEFFLPAYIPFALFPSMVFWSSGVLKESLSYLCMGIMAFIFLDFYIKNRIGILSIILFLLMGWIYWNLKYYLVILMVVSMVSVLVSDTLSEKFNIKQIPVILGLVFAILIVAGTFLHPNFALNRIVGVLQENHMKIIALSHHKNTVPFIPVPSSAAGIFINLPVALFAGLFMPLPFQGSGLLTLAPGLINLIILLTTLLLTYRGIYFPQGKLKLLLFGSLIYIIILATLLSYSTPNFGTLERYKVSYLPFYIFIILEGIWPWFSGSAKLMEKT